MKSGGCVVEKYMRWSLTNTEKQQKGVECPVWGGKSKTAPKPSSSQTHCSSLRLDVTKSAFLTNPLVSMTSAISLLKSYVPLPVYWPSDSPVVVFPGLKCLLFLVFFCFLIYHGYKLFLLVCLNSNWLHSAICTNYLSFKSTNVKISLLLQRKKWATDDIVYSISVRCPSIYAEPLRLCSNGGEMQEGMKVQWMKSSKPRD